MWCVVVAYSGVFVRCVLGVVWYVFAVGAVCSGLVCVVGVVCIVYVCVMECVGMRAVCVGSVVAGGRESCKCVVAQRHQSVIQKQKRSVR